MANINKSFNFRNGVQVDNDNFVVNPNGLVGIGTSIPREFLDVYGTAKITGLTTTNTLYAGIATVGFLTAKQGISVLGVVTATSFSGSASGLTGIYAIAVNGWYVTSGSISTTSKVGIGTTNPQGNLQIGTGVTINSNGNAIYSGILTASSFIGSGSGLTSLDSTQLTGTISNDRLSSNINVSGIITASTRFNGNLTGNVTGVASTALSLSGTPNIIIGFATATQFIGNVTGIASTALSLNGSPSITVTNINATNSGIITSIKLVSGISSVGIATVSTRLYAESIGVGTNSPTNDIHVRRILTSAIQLTSDTAEAIIAIGRSTILEGSNGAIRFGNTSSLQRYSTTKSLDIINYDTGNINSYLQLGSTGINTGSFNWIYGQLTPNTPLMTLTYTGNLGLGVTNPTEKLKVSGSTSITGNLSVDQSITATSNITATNGDISATNGNLFADNNLTVNGTTTLNNLIVNGSFTQPLPNYTSGIATFYDANVSNTLILRNIGVSTNILRGISALDALDQVSIFGAIGVGSDTPISAIDFSNAGKNTDVTLSFMVPPKVSSSQRVGLTTIEGGVIYNTTVKRLELYLGNGRGWVGIATVA